MYLRRANRNRDRSLDRGSASEESGGSSLFQNLAAIFRETKRCDREGERKTDNRQRFVGGCDESKSSSHWTELRKSVDREDLRETEEGGGGGGRGGGGGKGGGGDGGWW